MHALQDWRVAARRIGELHALAFLEGTGGGALAALGELRLVIPLKRVFRVVLALGDHQRVRGHVHGFDDPVCHGGLRCVGSEQQRRTEREDAEGRDGRLVNVSMKLHVLCFVYRRLIFVAYPNLGRLRETSAQPMP